MDRPKWCQTADRLSGKSKAYKDFHRALKTSSTKSTYAYAMKRFMDFLVEQKELKHNEAFDIVAKFDTEKVTDILLSYVDELNKNHKRSGVSTMLAGVELFFEMNRIIWHKKIVRKSIKQDKNNIKGGKIPATDEDVKAILDVSKHVRSTALIYFLASTGSRPAGIVDPVLRMKHLIEMPGKCYAIKIYDESNEGYWTFLTPEARKALDKYLNWRKTIRHEEITDESPIFTNFSKHAKTQHLSISNLNNIVNTLIKSSGIERKKTGFNYDKAMTKMFRKRFNGKLKMENQVNSNIAEKLMAHKRGLDGVYLQPTREECFAEFEKAIPVLMVDPTQRQKVELERKQKKIDELEEKNHRITNLESNQIQLRDIIDSLVDELTPRVHAESAVRKEQEAIESFEEY